MVYIRYYTWPTGDVDLYKTSEPIQVNNYQPSDCDTAYSFWLGIAAEDIE